MILRFAYLSVVLLLALATGLVSLYRLMVYRYPVLIYPLVPFLKGQGTQQPLLHRPLLFLIRLLLLALLAILSGRLQWVDSRSNVHIDGVDMVLAIDVSGSMELFDDLRDQRSRLDVAKAEAIRFIERRTDDPIGIVIFGADALSIAPLTLDKQMLKSLIGDLHIGVVDPRGTVLGTGLATAINRLRTSKAKSKVIILLTDGQPQGETNVDPESAIAMAKEFGIKIYTIGMGNEQGGYARSVFGQVVPFGQQTFDHLLLAKIAGETGGRSFTAANPSQLRQIYEEIDALEKTSYETNLFHRYYEVFESILWLLLAVLAFDLVGRLIIWRGLA